MSRYQYAVAAEEMERRHRLVLSEMEQVGVECLVLESNHPFLGGALQYLTDFPVDSYPRYGLFSKEGAVIVGHGGRGRPVKPAHLPENNVDRQYAVPMVISMTYADEWVPRLMAQYIQERQFHKIGLVGMQYISANIYQYLTQHLPECEFVNASAITDHARAVKSEYELSLYRNAAAIHDQIMAQVPNILRPGRTEREVVKEIEHLASELDCPGTNVLIGSHPTFPTPNPNIFTNKVIEETDCVMLLVELLCPYYVWGELGRVFTFREPSEEMKAACNCTQYIQDLLMEHSVPGADPRDLIRMLNQALTEKGYFPEARIAIHGQSCDIVESPCFCEDEPMALEENMVLACHPTCANKEIRAFSCDNYLVTKRGGVRMVQTPRGLIQL